MTEPTFWFASLVKHDNMGDRLLSRFLVNALRRRGRVRLRTDGVPVAHLDLLEAQAEERLGVGQHTPLHMVSARFGRRWSAVPQRDILVLNPGDYFGGARGLDALRHIGALGALRLLAVSGFSVMRFGASMGPFMEPRLTLERLKAPCFDVLGIRDEISEAYVKSNRLGSPVRCPDLAFLCTDDPLFAARSVKRDTVTISLRSSVRGDSDRSYREKLLHFTSQFIVAARAVANLRIALVAQVAEDSELLDELTSRVGPVDAFVRFDPDRNSSIDDVLDEYGRSALTLTNRLHSMLFGLAMGSAPVVVTALQAHSKLSGILRELEMEDCAHDLDSSLDAGRILSAALLDPTLVVARFKGAQAAFYDQINALFDAKVGAPRRGF